MITREDMIGWIMGLAMGSALLLMGMYALVSRNDLAGDRPSAVQAFR
jgi:hypothetical protein